MAQKLYLSVFVLAVASFGYDVYAQSAHGPWVDGRVRNIYFYNHEDPICDILSCKAITEENTCKDQPRKCPYNITEFQCKLGCACVYHCDDIETEICFVPSLCSLENIQKRRGRKRSTKKGKSWSYVSTESATEENFDGIKINSMMDF